jgi:Gpi18-like mannosyltransferase
MLLEEDLWKTKFPVLKQFLTADTYAYQVIADQWYDDYRIDEPHPPANWVFFPLFPLLLRIFAKLTNADYMLTGLVISNLFLIASMIYLYYIAIQRGLKDMEAKLGVGLLLIAPAAIFLFVPYTESLFLMLSMGAIYYSHKGKWLPALIMAGLCTVTRNVGVVILLYTACCMLLERGFRKPERGDLLRLLYLIVGCIPLASYLGYMKWLTGDFLAPINEQINWGRHTSIPFTSYIHYLTDPYFQTSSGWENGLISFLIGTFVIIIMLLYPILRWRNFKEDGRQILLYGATILLIAIPFSSGEHLASIPRYMLVCFPIYFYVVELFRKNALVLIGCFMLSFFFHILFTIGYFNNYFFVF